MNNDHCPVLGFCAYSGTGKTTLLTKLLPQLKQMGIHVAVIKPTHHDFEIDKPGKDSYELRKAGADQVLLASSHRRALITETPGAGEPQLEELLDALDLRAIDLVLVEGFRHETIPKIELHRSELGTDLIFPSDPCVIAVATDVKLDTGAMPLLSINRPVEVAAFIVNWLNKTKE